MEDVKRQTEIKIEQHPRVLPAASSCARSRRSSAKRILARRKRSRSSRRSRKPKLPEKVAQEARRETERMRMLSPASSEYQVVRTYLDWVLSLPFNKRSGSEEIDLKKVQEALDSRHLRTR